MRQLRAKGIRHADAPVRVGASERVIFIAALEEFMNDDALVNDIDSEIVCFQMDVVVAQLAWVGDDRLIAFGAKVFLQYAELAFGRDTFPIDNSDLRMFFLAAPF